MATALDLIKRAMRLAQVSTKGETPDNDESQDGLDALNTMLDSWQVDRLFVYQIREESFTWAANDQTQTVGSGGDFNTDLPTRIADDCAFVVNSIDFPAQLIGIDAWTQIPDKTTTSTFPWFIYPEYGAALVTLSCYPIPSANVSFKLRTWKRLQSFTALTTDLSLPPGYQRAIEFSLAEEIAGEYGTEIPPRVSAIAMNARRLLRKINSPSPVMRSDAGRLTRRHTANVKADVA